MTKPVSDLAFTPAVKAWQERLGSRAGYARRAEKGDWRSSKRPSRVIQVSSSARAMFSSLATASTASVRALRSLTGKGAADSEKV